MAEARPPQATDARQQNGGVVGSGLAQPGGAEPSPQATSSVWDFGSAATGRPVTPPVETGHSLWRHAPAPAPQAGARQQVLQQRAGTPASQSTPPSAKPGSGLLRAVRTGSGSLTGLLRRPATAAAAPAGGSPGGSPLFEVRGAAMLPPEPARPTTAGTSSANAAPHAQRPATAHPPPQQQKYASGSPLAYSIQARAGYRAAAAASASSSSPQASAQHRQPTAVAAHGLDLASSPVAQVPTSPALSLSRQLEAAAARQQQEVAQGHGHGFSHGSSATSHPSMSASDRSSSGGGRANTAAPGTGPTTTVHSNPLYSAGSEAYAKPRRQNQQQAAAPTRQPPPVRVPPAAAAAAASLPPTPVAGLSVPSAGTTPGASPLAGTLQAASNLTIVSDSRPISPGPFLSTLASGALPDSAFSRSHPSRPVSPQCVDSAPPTPGSFAPLSAAAAAAARGSSNLSPIKTSAGAAQTRSVPAPPSPPASAAGPAVATQGPAAGASAGANPFRLPIFNQDGRLVGYKQNSNLIPRPGTTISSAPSSPNRSGPSTSDGFAPQPSVEVASPQKATAAPAAPAAVQPVPAVGASVDFAEFVADPCRGFPDADNVVPGYVLGPILGKGGFCSVRKALHEMTGQAVACKIIEKGKLKDPKDRDRVDRECRVMRNLSNHVSVVKLFEYVETKDYVYIMMEAAKRGSLLDYVRDRKKLPEEEAVTIFQQLLHALQFCHRKDVVHRDVKLENILIDSAGHMKLIDFGLCGYYVAGKRLRCHCGSPSYAAPEIVARKDYLGPPVDVWSLGIVLFAMLAGYLPFHAKEKKQLSEKILAGAYKPAAWMSPDAQDLISRMLTLDPDQRITMEAVWAHPWVANAPRWEPPGVGAGRLYRSLTDPSTGALLPDDAVMAHLELLGADTAAIRRALRSRECNSLTATYHLVFEARVEAQRATTARERAAAGERAAAAAAAVAAAVAAAKKAAPAASTAGDWQWDFHSLCQAANAHNDAGGSGSSGGAAGSHGSAGSNSLRSSGSPARPRTAVVVQPVSSPTRFGQEAAAAGYLGSRPGSSATAGPANASAAPPASSAPEWGIKAVHAGVGRPAEQAADFASPTGKVTCMPAPVSPKAVPAIAQHAASPPIAQVV